MCDQLVTFSFTAGNVNACTQTPGYYHRTDQSAMNCCQLLRSLQISDDTSARMKRNGMEINGSSLSNQNDMNQMAGEIQCKDISQSQMSPVVRQQNVRKPPQMQQPPPSQQQQQQQQQSQQPIPNMYAASMPMQMTNTTPSSAMPTTNLNVQSQQTSMRPDIYQRTLEYVQNCQSWTEHSETVTSTSNMQISDMSTSLSSLLEENRYYNSVL